MDDEGFAIWCPHCAKWNQWPEIDPETMAVGRVEFDDILKGLRQASDAGKPWDYTHKKLIRCTRPRWACPSSFEAIVFRSWEEMKSCLRDVPGEWPFKRDFRLYRINCIDRWEDQYWGIMFCTPPFRRMRDIEFESLMDRELLSRLIVGMSVEINSVLTIFGANIFEPKGEDAQVYWMPIEGYSREKRLTPPRFNKFCNCLRDIEMRKLIKQYEDKNISVDNCPIKFGRNGNCADKDSPACKREREPDWCHCPSFMKEREKRSLCYGSDLSLIGKVAKSNPREAMECGIEHLCPAKFKEYGFPIMVHDHLVAVVMIGQVFSDPKQIAEVDEIVSKCKLLEGNEDDLDGAKQDLIEEERRLREKNEPRFFMDADEVQRRIDLIRPNIERVTEMANARYRDIRRRSEAVFREEVLEYFQTRKNDPKFFHRVVPHILKRMRKFWSFKAVFLVAYSHTSKDIRIIAMSSTDKGETPYGVPGKKVGKADPTYRQTHPIRYLYRRDKLQEGLDPLVKDLLHVFDEVSRKDEFSVEGGHARDASHLFVLVPFSNEVYAFIFSVRDAKGLCRLERSARGDVSDLCQEIMLRLCTEVVYEFGDVWYREASEQRIKLDAWRSFSARTAHKIGNRVFVARGALRRQKHVDSGFEGIRELELSVDRIGQISNDFIRFSADQPPKLQCIEAKTLITEEVALYDEAGKEQNIDVKFLGPLGECEWDPKQIQEVIGELLENAMNHRHQNGKISITVEPFEEDSTRMVRIVVYNEGKGIDENDKVAIFEPFHSTHPERAGLGLSIVKRIIENHNGRIGEIGEPGRNAEFVVELPEQVE